MIFAAVGTQMHFDRMIRTLDDWAGRHPDIPVIAQVGEGSCRPKFLQSHAFLPPEQFSQFQSEADVLVSHAGMGAILSACMLEKPLIIMPRQLAFNEHRNDHQLATAKYFDARTGIHVAWDEAVLCDLLDRQNELAALTKLPAEASPELLSAIGTFIDTGGVR